jgi:chorismate mutase
MTTTTAPDIDALRLEIDRLDAEILAAIKRRAEVSHRIGDARMASGGTRLVHQREMAVIERYGELGRDGKDFALLLLRLSRGQLGQSSESSAGSSYAPVEPKMRIAEPEHNRALRPNLL